MSQHTNSEPTVSIALNIMEMKDKLGLEGLVPSALILGQLTSVSTRSEKSRKRVPLEDSSAVKEMARDEISCIMDNMRIDRELKYATKEKS